MKLTKASSLLLVASSFSLTGIAHAQHTAPARLRLVIDLDPALAMGPQIQTIIPVRVPGTERRFVHSQHNFGRAIGATYWNRPYFYWSGGSYDGPTLLGRASMIENAPRVEAARPRRASSLERVLDAIREGRYQDALALEVQIGDGEPASDRLLVALEGGGRTGEAARLLVDRIAVGGAAEALQVDRAGLTRRTSEVRRMQGLAAQYATESNDPNAHILLASHLIGLGQEQAARRAIERAIEAGLDGKAAAALKSLGADLSR